MTSRLIRDDISNFRIRRAVATVLNGGPDVHAGVRAHLEELNTLLGKAVFASKPPGNPKGAARGRRAANRALNGQGGGPNQFVIAQLRALLARSLTPKRVPPAKGKHWADNSLGDHLSSAATPATNLNLADLIDKTPELAQLKYSFLDAIQEGWNDVSANARIILQHYPNIRDSLIAYAYVIQGVRDDDALKNLVTNHKDGARRIVGYAAVSAARTFIDEKQLRVEDYNDDTSDFVRRMQSADFVLSQTAFDKSVQALIDDFIYDRDEEKIIDLADKAKIGDVPSNMKPLLVKFMQNSPIKITQQNAETYLPHFMLQIRRMQGAPDPSEGEGELPPEDFRVRFDDRSDPAIENSVSAVLCASQSFHAMVLGEELDVFGAVNYLTTRKLVMGGGIRFKDLRLRRDLQDYVFDSEFMDIAAPNARMNRTRPAERQMFYRQLFDFGDAASPDDMPVNGEFQQLWKVLMIEAAHYLERAQASPHPDSFVSGQGVAQSVEDLQYNLSRNCTGMATVIAPITDAELAFVLERILKHEEIVRYVVPEGGTWKNVVDTLNSERARFERREAGRRMPVCNAATLYNKARQGKNIIEAIATYVPGDFDDFGKLSGFIGLVDGFITTNSILQRNYRKSRVPQPPLKRDEEDEEDTAAQYDEESAARPEDEAATVGSDEWDF
jgi:hypothetical protein